MKGIRSLGALLLGWFLLSMTAYAEPSLQALVDQTPENGTLQLENKTYVGNLTITKPITITGAERSVLQGDGKGNVVTIQSPHVHLKGLTITNSSLSRNDKEEYAAVKVHSDNNTLEKLTITDSYHGIYLSAAHHNVIRGANITGQGGKEVAGQGNGIMVYYSNENTITDNTISDTRDGIFFDHSNHNVVKKNQVSHTRYGLHYMYSDQNQLVGNTFSSNIGGAALMHSIGTVLNHNIFTLQQGTRAFGVMLQSCDDSQIENNRFYQNQRALYIDQSVRNRIESNEIMHNQVGIELWASSSEQVFTGNRLSKNTVPVILIGGASNNSWSENGAGNDWGKEMPIMDLNQDGIGDQSVQYKSALYKLIEENELVYLFLNSPAIDIYELIGKFVHEQKMMVEDPYPLVKTGKETGSLWLLGLVPILVLGTRKYWRSRRINS